MKERIKNITQKVKDHERVIWIYTVTGMGASLVVMTMRYNTLYRYFDDLSDAILELEIMEDVVEQVLKNKNA